MRVVTTRLRCAGDLRFVPSFEQPWDGVDTRSLFWYCCGLGVTTLAAMPLGSTRMKPHPRNSPPPCRRPPSSYSSSSLRGKGGLGATAVRAVMLLSLPMQTISLSRPSLRVRTLLALSSGVLVLGSVW
jgi:hypothetical protein